MKRRFLKKLSIMFLAVMVLFSCLSPPGISAIFAAEEESTAVTEIEVTTDTAVPEEELQDVSYQEDASVAEIPDAAAEEIVAEDIQESTEKQAEMTLTEEQSSGEEAKDATEEKLEESENVEAESSAEESSKEEPAEESTATETKETEETKESMPAHTFYGAANGVSVVVEAEEGTFPEGTTMKVTAVSAAAIFDSVNAAVEGEVTAIKAVDITFFNTEGKEIQPLIPVHMTMNAAGMDRSADKEIVHIDDSNRADVINDAAINGNEAVLDAGSFSIYAVVTTGDNARLQVNFINGVNEIASPIVKKSDMGSETLFNQIIYDPGAGELPAGTVFRGWTTKEDYTVDDIDSGMNIEAVRAAVKAKLNEGVEEVSGNPEQMNFYAMTFHVFNVTFKDEENVVIKNEALLTKGESIAYTVNQPYTPKTSDQEFQGWYVGTENAIAKDGTYYEIGDTIPNETAVTISQDVVLSAKAPNGAWLIFKENGAGASYTSPQFLENAAPVKPADPVRNGYIFGGWYTEDGEEFNFNAVLEKTTKVFARWTPVTNARYTVLIWKQNVAGNGYDFAESLSFTGTVGQPVSTVSQRGTGDNAYAQINGTNYRYTGFHLDNYNQNVEINPEGTAVVNVYYNRTSYTLTFRSSWNSTVYKTITALYEQPIGENFPITDNGASAEWRWRPYNSSTFKQVLVYIDIMPAENVTFYPNESSASTKYMEFYVEALPGQTPDRTWNGRSFVQHGATIPAKYNFFTRAEDFLELTGFNQLGSDPQFNSSGEANVPAGGTIRFYYTRKAFSVNYMDGIYVDGGGNEIEEINRGQLQEKSNIVYGADLSSYNKGGANYYEPTYTGYVFEGWYVDDACVQPYTFSTMPDGGITVYAKWRQIQYRIFLHPNADEYQGYQIGDQSTSFRLSYGEGLDAIKARSDDYELVGWYTNEACTNSINFDAFVANDINITAAYDQTESTERDQYGKPTENTNKDAANNRFWITRKLDLYAKWRSKLLGANGITIIYDAGDGSFSSGGKEYTDPLTYKDRAEAVATTATNPSDPSKYEFECWDIQKWNGEEFVSSGVTVLPGDGFEVLKADAHITENEDSTPAEPSYTYTIKLVAVYKAIEEETLTHIYWYANNKTDAVKKDEGLKMNEPVAIEPADLFSYEGYELIGWARYAEDEDAPASPTEADHLWLVYDKDSKAFKENGTHVTKVACDEKRPYHDLYAVWAPIKYTVVFDKNAEDATGEMADEKFTFDEEKALTANAFSRENYEFLGWSTEESATTVTYTDKQSVKNLTKEADTEITLYAVWQQKVADVTVHHYLKGTTTKVAEDTTREETIGTSIDPASEKAATTFIDTYAEYSLTKDSTNPTQPVTVTVDGVEIILYYTLPLKITAKSDSKVYDGNALTNDEYELSGDTPLLDGDEIDSVTVTGSQTLVGSSDNVPSEAKVVRADGSEAAYYQVEYVNGTLTVTDGTNPGDDPVDPNLVVTKAVQEDKTYKLGDEVTFAITATNIYEEAGTITLEEINGVTLAQATFENVAGGATIETTATYTITQADILAGSFINTVTAKLGNLTKTAQAKVNTDPADGTISVTKTADKDTYSYGETVNYTIVVKNTGNLTISDIEVTDELTGGVTPADKFTLEPGASKELTATYVVTASNVEATTINNTAAAKGKDPNGKAVETKGSVVVKTAPIEITITAANDKKVYDGSALTNSGYELTGGQLADGDKISSVTVSGSQTLVGSSKNVASGAKVADAAGNDVTKGYKISYVDGTLTVTDGTNPDDPKPVDDDKVVTKTDGKDDAVYHIGDTVTWTIWVKNIYDAEKSLTVTEKEGVSLSAYPATLAAGEEITITATYVVTAEDVAAGSFKNEVTAKLGDLEKDGDDTVETAPIEITITAASDKKVYDGSALTNSGYELTGGQLADGDKISSVTVSGSQTLVGSSKNVASDAKVADAAGNDVTKGYKISYVDGTLTVTDGTNPDDPKPVDDDKVVKKTDDKEGTIYHVGDTVTWTIWVKNIYAETKTVTVTDKLDGVTLTGYTEGQELAAGEELEITATYVVTAEDVEKGEIRNEVEAELGNLDKPGESTVETEPIEITITAASDKKVYDGSALTNSGYELTGGQLADGDKISSVTVSGSQTPVGSSKNMASDAKIADAAGKDVTKGYKISYVDGTLEITPAQLTVTTPSANKVYDGAALTATGATITGLVNGETATAVANGSQTAVGSSQNGYAITWGTAKASNYTIIANLGTLTVTEAPGPGPIPEPVPEIVPIIPVVPPTPPAPEPEIVDDDDVPEVEPTTEPEEIDDDDTPVAPGEPTWALINLILSIIAVITAIIMAITFFFAKKKEDEDEEQQAQKAPKAEGEEEEEKKKSYKGLKFLGFIPAAAAVILFILTENMHFKMILVDKWTILTAVFAVIAIVIGILTRNKKDKEEDEAANGEQA